MSNQIKIVKPQTEAQKATETTLDTWAITEEIAKMWELPPFQRGLRTNTKVTDLASELAVEIASHGEVVLPGVFCLGRLDGKIWLVDGQHRRQAFFLACEIVRTKDKNAPKITGYADVRIVHFKTMAEMAAEFRRLNSRLVNMKPDDVIKAMEQDHKPIADIRRACPYVGYDGIRRSDKGPVVGMSAVIRTWHGSKSDMPRVGGTSAPDLAEETTPEDSSTLIDYLQCAFTAWGRDAAYVRLWSTLNLSITMWLYRAIVMTAYSQKTKKISKETYTKALMALSADPYYVDWLRGRGLNQKDVPPCYNKVKAIVAKTLGDIDGQKHLLPQPAWARGFGR